MKWLHTSFEVEFRLSSFEEGGHTSASKANHSSGFGSVKFFQLKREAFLQAPCTYFSQRAFASPCHGRI